MLQRVRRLVTSVCRRPVRSLAVLVGLLLVAAPLGLHCWALQRFQAAEQALQDDCMAEARDDVGFCLTVWPYSARTHLLAARISRLTGDYPRAETELSECSRLQTEATAETRLERVMLRAEREGVGEVEKDLVAMVDRDAANAPFILEALGRGERNDMHYLPAQYYFTLCVKRFPNYARALDGRGEVQERVGRLKAAAKDYERALELSHGRADVRLRLAALYLDEEETERAKPHLDMLEKTHPDQPEVQAVLASYCFLTGREDAARDLLDRVLAVRPDDQPALSLRGAVALQEGKPEEAEGYYRRYLKENRSNPVVYFALYSSLRAQPGREEEAEAALKERDRVSEDSKRLFHLLSVELDQSGQSPDVLSEMGELSWRLGMKEPAARWLLAALRKDPDQKRAHQVLAEYYDAKGDSQAAQQHRRLAD